MLFPVWFRGVFRTGDKLRARGRFLARAVGGGLLGMAWPVDREETHHGAWAYLTVRSCPAVAAPSPVVACRCSRPQAGRENPPLGPLGASAEPLLCHGETILLCPNIPAPPQAAPVKNPAGVDLPAAMSALLRIRSALPPATDILGRAGNVSS